MNSLRPLPAARQFWAIYLLWSCVGFQAAGGIWGGFALVVHPSGSWLQMPLYFLKGTPFPNYFFPGLILLVLLGIYPAFVLYGLVSRTHSELFGSWNLYGDQHLAWGGSLYVGLLLVLWMDFEVMFVGYRHWVQTVYALLGVAIVWLTLLPRVREYYRLH